MSQSLAQIWIHLVFSTKERQPFLKEASIRERLYDYIKGICNENQCNIAAIGGVEDHIHMLINVNKKITLVHLVEEIKKSSSKWIKSLHGEKNKLNHFYWQRGYGAFSVSQSNVERVKAYIKNQYHHHQKLNFEEELKKILIHHGVVFDEKYLFD